MTGCSATTTKRKRQHNMDALTLFGVLAVTAMLLFYAAGGPKPLVHSGVRGRLRARIGIWLSTRGLAFWSL